MPRSKKELLITKPEVQKHRTNKRRDFVIEDLSLPSLFPHVSATPKRYWLMSSAANGDGRKTVMYSAVYKASVWGGLDEVSQGDFQCLERKWGRNKMEGDDSR